MSASMPLSPPESPPNDTRANSRSGRGSQLAVVGIWLWAASVFLFLAAIVLGLIVAATGPGGDTGQAWTPLLLPALSLVTGVPLGIAAIIVAILSLVRRHERKGLAITTIVLAAVPGALILLLALARAVLSAGVS